MANRRNRSRLRVSRILIVALLAQAAVAWAQQQDAAAGERLFSGATRFARGGPPCGACHDAAGLPFPHGGSVGPDLTGSYAKYGPGPLETVLSTLYFPTMEALFAGRTPTLEERRDLTAFLQRSAATPPSTSLSPELAAAALAGALALLAVVWVVWRRRLRGVRREIVAAAKGRWRS